MLKHRHRTEVGSEVPLAYEDTGVDHKCKLLSRLHHTNPRVVLAQLLKGANGAVDERESWFADPPPPFLIAMLSY